MLGGVNNSPAPGSTGATAGADSMLGIVAPIGPSVGTAANSFKNLESALRDTCLSLARWCGWARVGVRHHRLTNSIKRWQLSC